MSNNLYEFDAEFLKSIDKSQRNQDFSNNVVTPSEDYLIKSQLAIKTYLGVLCQRGSILAYECGDGHQIYGLSNAVSYNSSSEAEQTCKSYGIKTISSKELKGKQFDVILCSSGHLLKTPSPIEYLNSLKTLLSKHGKIVFALKLSEFESSGISQYVEELELESISKLFNALGLTVVHGEINNALIENSSQTANKFLGIKRHLKFLKLIGKLKREKEMILHVIPS